MGQLPGVPGEVSVRGAREAAQRLIASIGLRVQSFATALQFLGSSRPDGWMPGARRAHPAAERARHAAGAVARAGTPIPIIFITGHGDIPMSVKAMKAGAVEFLTKPFRDQELLDAIQLGLERARQPWARAESQESRGRYRSLTAREREVMACLVAGLLNK